MGTTKLHTLQGWEYFTIPDRPRIIWRTIYACRCRQIVGGIGPDHEWQLPPDTPVHRILENAIDVAWEVV